ncbi:unnamed protein product [Mesocestoides corti]|uniref:PLAT domain-containing protein n=1 Tax=Mesocestoides corti TaxID=53468 RepID=A0A0R3UHE0_MESCO|nr:unnamed protein product [Mesocestoides corti]
MRGTYNVTSSEQALSQHTGDSFELEKNKSKVRRLRGLGKEQSSPAVEKPWRDSRRLLEVQLVATVSAGEEGYLEWYIRGPSDGAGSSMEKIK